MLILFVAGILGVLSSLVVVPVCLPLGLVASGLRATKKMGLYGDWSGELGNQLYAWAVLSAQCCIASAVLGMFFFAPGMALVLFFLYMFVSPDDLKTEYLVLIYYFLFCMIIGQIVAFVNFTFGDLEQIEVESNGFETRIMTEEESKDFQKAIDKFDKDAPIEGTIF